MTRSKDPSLGQSAVIIGASIAAGLVMGAILVSATWAPTTSGTRGHTTSVSDATTVSDTATVGDTTTVPRAILETAAQRASPDAPGLRLQRTVMSLEWEERRADIEELATRRRRQYAIGDLLPNGSLLVAVDETSVEIMVGDSFLVTLHDDGRTITKQDLTATSGYNSGGAGSVIALRRTSLKLGAEYEGRVLEALAGIREDNPSVVQASIDELIGCGDPAIEFLFDDIDSILPVRPAEYEFPRGGNVRRRPTVVGEIIMSVLESITGQTFGDLGRDDLSGERRSEIAQAWRRWWGLDAGP